MEYFTGMFNIGVSNQVILISLIKQIRKNTCLRINKGDSFIFFVKEICNFHFLLLIQYNILMNIASFLALCHDMIEIKFVPQPNENFILFTAESPVP